VQRGSDGRGRGRQRPPPAPHHPPAVLTNPKGVKCGRMKVRYSIRVEKLENAWLGSDEHASHIPRNAHRRDPLVYDADTRALPPLEFNEVGSRGRPASTVSLPWCNGWEWAIIDEKRKPKPRPTTEHDAAQRASARAAAAGAESGSGSGEGGGPRGASRTCAGGNGVWEAVGRD
jgi:hypothetical protein